VQAYAGVKEMTKQDELRERALKLFDKFLTDFDNESHQYPIGFLYKLLLNDVLIPMKMGFIEEDRKDIEKTTVYSWVTPLEEVK
jgi:hypothetical protein